jgi:spermidine/putrescine-binding protein
MSGGQVPSGSGGHSRRAFLTRSARAAGALAVGSSAGGLLGACGADQGGGDQAAAPAGLTREAIASAQGTVKVLGWEYYEVPAFESPQVEARWGYLGTNEDTITKSRQEGTFDLTTILSAYDPQLRKVGRIQPWDPKLLQNFNRIDATFRDSPTIRYQGRVWAIPFQWGYGYLEYDKRQTTKPTSLADLMSPKLRKKIGMPDDPYTVITTFAILTGKPRPNSLTRAEFDDVLRTLNRFKPQILTIHNYGEEPAIIARGDMAIDFPAYGPSFLTARAGGAKTEITLLGAFSYLDCMTLYKGANLPLAYKYVDQTLTVPAQRACVKKGAAFPVMDAAKDVVPKELRYRSAKAIIDRAPLLPGPPADASGGLVPFSEWVSAWESFKAGI